MAEKLSLYELQMIIRDSIYISLPEMYWVTAEISEIKENYAGHCYLELIEKQSDERNIRARVKAVIWCKKYGFLKAFFESSTGETLKEGLKILVKIKVEYHELYGLSLVICDIDPSYTAGDLAVKRKMIITRLENEGVFTMNKELGLPPVIRQIAVISSSKAAGYTDFIKHLNGNRHGYIYYTKLFESPMQGNDTEQGIISALDRVAAHSQLFDAVTIIRGGGSQADLSWFDNYAIAYHITQFPLPVLTGIGHEKDMSVADLVACMALKTPTAVADYIINRTLETDSALTEAWISIKDKTREILESNRKQIDSCSIRLHPMAKVLISEIREMLSEKSLKLMNYGKSFTREAGIIPVNHLSRLISSAKDLISRRKNSLELFEKTLEFLSPDNVLARGYTITRRNGVPIKEAKDVKEGDLLETQFRDGAVPSSVLHRKKKETNE